MRAIAALLLCLLIAPPANAHARHHGHHHRVSREHHRGISAGFGHRSAGNPDHAGLTRIRLIDGQIITVASAYADRFRGFLDALYRREGRLPHIGCYSPTGHMPHSLHHWGGACDVGQRARNVAWRAMYHIGALAAQFGLTDGCSWRHPDCGHVDVSGLIGHTQYARRRRPIPVGDRREHIAKASWYDEPQRVACGGFLSNIEPTVANKTLPCGTMVFLSYRGRSVLARVDDRGPYKGNREFDLGPRVAHELRFDGVHNITYRIER